MARRKGDLEEREDGKYKCLKRVFVRWRSHRTLCMQDRHQKSHDYSPYDETLRFYAEKRLLQISHMASLSLSS
jgi:hypothetical protein